MASDAGDLATAPVVAAWIGAARQGSEEALGRLLEACRPYLLLVANQEMIPELAGKFGPSDLVQDTFLEAHRDFARFNGTTEAELLAWLRRILLNNAANVSRRYQATDKRLVGREIPPRDSAVRDLLESIIDRQDSPSALFLNRERDQALEQALGQLPELGQQAIRWRNYDRLSFEAIGARLGRSAGAARKVWARAIEQLRQRLESSHESC